MFKASASTTAGDRRARTRGGDRRDAGGEGEADKKWDGSKSTAAVGVWRNRHDDEGVFHGTGSKERHEDPQKSYSAAHSSRYGDLER